MLIVAVFLLFLFFAAILLVFSVCRTIGERIDKVIGTKGVGLFCTALVICFIVPYITTMYVLALGDYDMVSSWLIPGLILYAGVALAVFYAAARNLWIETANAQKSGKENGEISLHAIFYLLPGILLAAAIVFNLVGATWKGYDRLEEEAAVEREREIKEAYDSLRH